jgi:hypothetical protein
MIGSSVFLGMLVALPISAQTAPAASSTPASTSHVRAQLLSSVKAAKARVNDPVRAQTMTPLTLADGTVIPIGSTLSGHVLKVESDSGDRHMSSIAITFESVDLKKRQRLPFESVELKKRQTLPLKLSIASAKAPAPAAALIGDNTSQTASRNADGVADSHALSDAYTAQDDSTGLVTSGSDGTPGKAKAAHTGSVIGLPGVTLVVDDGPNAVSTFISAKKNFQLDSGLHLMLVVAPLYTTPVPPRPILSNPR